MDNGSSFIGITVIIIIFFGGLFVVKCAGSSCVQAVTEKTIIIKIKRKEKTAESKFIYTRNRVFTVDDHSGSFSFNSDDTYNKLIVGNKCKVVVTGFRVGFTSSYPNIYKILKCEEMKTNVKKVEKESSEVKRLKLEIELLKLKQKDIKIENVEIKTVKEIKEIKDEIYEEVEDHNEVIEEYKVLFYKKNGFAPYKAYYEDGFYYIQSSKKWNLVKKDYGKIKIMIGNLSRSINKRK